VLPAVFSCHRDTKNRRSASQARGAPTIRWSAGRSLAEFSPHRQQHGDQGDDGEIRAPQCARPLLSSHESNARGERWTKTLRRRGTCAPQGSTSCRTCNSDDSGAMEAVTEDVHAAKNFLLLPNSTDMCREPSHTRSKHCPASYATLPNPLPGLNRVRMHAWKICRIARPFHRSEKMCGL
jgi:hypothetical protein